MIGKITRSCPLRARARKQVMLVAIVYSLIFPSEPANAQSCSISPATGSFGSVNVLAGTSFDSASSLSVSCSGTANTSVRLCIELGRGASPAGPSGERALTVGSNFLDFEFYTDAARTQVWGSWGSVIVGYGPGGFSNDLPLGPTGSASVTLPVYARIAAGQQAKNPATYNWNGLSPGLVYGYVTGTSCPTGSATTNSGGTTWDTTVVTACSISTTAMDFGSSPSSISSDLDSTATITARCTNTTPYSVGLDSGINGSGGQRRVRLAATSNYINYNLYTDFARLNPWTATSSATACTGGANSCVLGTGAGSDQTITVYGRIPPQTAPSAGTFTDVVVVTLTF